MTNREYIRNLTSKFGVSDVDVEMLLVTQQLDGDASVDVIACKKSAYKKFSTLIPLKNVSEGDYSETWNWEGLTLWYSLLAKELGEVDVISELNAPDDEVNDASFYS
ncbi:DUF6706 family protein [Soonwooa purpurea]